jgi:hypothetical protein
MERIDNMEITKVTLRDLGNDKSWTEAVIVFTEDSFGRAYSELARSYTVKSDAKWFDPTMNGTSLFGNCLNGTDNGVRLDNYMRRLPEDGIRWKEEYCYITK